MSVQQRNKRRNTPGRVGNGPDRIQGEPLQARSVVLTDSLRVRTPGEAYRPQDGDLVIEWEA
jgi:hypothetical protein